MEGDASRGWEKCFMGDNLLVLDPHPLEMFITPMPTAGSGGCRG